MKKEIASFPTFEEIKDMWESVSVELVDFSSENLRRYIETLKTMYQNGKVDFHSFRISRHELIEYMIQNNKYHEMRFFRSFWEKPAVKQWLDSRIDDFNEYSRDLFWSASIFHFNGYLAQTIERAGAYTEFKGDWNALRELSIRVESDIIEGRFSSFDLFVSEHRWSDYFYDVAWDRTFIAVDKDNSVFHILIATDTD